MGPCPLGPKEIHGLLVHPGKAYVYATDGSSEYWLTFESAQEK